MNTIRRLLLWALVIYGEIALMVFVAILIDPILTSTTCGNAGQCTALAFREHPIRTVLVDGWAFLCLPILGATISVMIEDFTSQFRKGIEQQGTDNL